MKGAKTMHPTEKVVRQLNESWDMHDPDRGAEVIADDCAFEDIARGEKLPGTRTTQWRQINSARITSFPFRERISRRAGA
jgi:hypothetical protein